MSNREFEDDSFEHYCLDCNASVNPQSRICGNCGADISELVEEDEDANEDAISEAGSLFVKLLPDENILSRSRGLILTTHRIRFESRGWGYSQIKSIMLEELASCVATSSSNPILLVLAALCFLIGFTIASNSRDAAPPLIVAFFLALIFVISYAATRQQILALASGGTTIKVYVKVANVSELRGLIDEIEAAKNERYLIAKKNEAVKSVI